MNLNSCIIFLYKNLNMKSFKIKNCNNETLQLLKNSNIDIDYCCKSNLTVYTNQKSLDNIKSLRIFKDVKSEIVEGSSPNLKKIKINVEEQPTGEISLAAGVGTSGSTIGGGIREKNFLGKGINLNTNLELSEDSIKLFKPGLNIFSSLS